MLVKVHLLHQSKPVEIDNVRNTYQKGDFFCVMIDGESVQKFPIQHIFRVVEEWGGADSETTIVYYNNEGRIRPQLD